MMKAQGMCALGLFLLHSFILTQKLFFVPAPCIAVFPVDLPVCAPVYLSDTFQANAKFFGNVGKRALFNLPGMIDGHVPFMIPDVPHSNPSCVFQDTLYHAQNVEIVKCVW
jgi:hypothetical protein